MLSLENILKQLQSNITFGVIAMNKKIFFFYIIFDKILNNGSIEKMYEE